jgi:hypothetical protein
MAAPEIPIREIRGQRVLLDSDLAAIYGVSTAALNQAVKRNTGRFPDEFSFVLTAEEFELLISQNVISKPLRGGRTKQPRVFTEHGALQAANVLRSERAVAMSVFVIRAFVQMRAVLSQTGDLAKKLAELDRRLTSRLDVQEEAIFKVMRDLIRILNPPSPPPYPPKPRIGFKP